MSILMDLCIVIIGLLLLLVKLLSFKILAPALIRDRKRYLNTLSFLLLSIINIKSYNAPMI